jgi:hypothetical protein
LDAGLPNKNRLPLPSTTQPQSTTSSQLRRTNCQRRSPDSSPQSRQKTTNNQTLSKPSTATKGCRNGKHHNIFSNMHPNHNHTFFGNNTNNYYSSKMDRSIINCEKFLPDQELTNSTKENDLLLIHARQSTRFM